MGVLFGILKKTIDISNKRHVLYDALSRHSFTIYTTFVGRPMAVFLGGRFRGFNFLHKVANSPK